MKTLDEVIKALEHCQGKGCTPECPYETRCVHDGKASVEEDALHYLKEYKVVTDICHKHGIASVWGQVLPDPEKTDWDKKLNFDNAYDNDPLDWETLKTMKGKPVWLEDNLDEPGYIRKYWAIYQGIDKAQSTEYARISDLLYDKVYFGTEWQAYRKERE